MVIDQSDDDRTELSLQDLAMNPCLVYIRTSTRGLSAALNVGIAHARYEIIGITGDDCEVEQNWLSELVSAFTIDRRIGIVFGNILPGPHDQSHGFVPGYVRDGAFLARDISEKHHVAGTSACMGLRRSVWEELGGFDEMFGAGATLHSAEDTDLTI